MNKFNQKINKFTPSIPRNINGISSKKSQSALYSIKKRTSWPFPNGLTVRTIKAADMAQKNERHKVLRGK